MIEVEYKTTGSVLRSVADRWKEQYCDHRGEWEVWYIHSGDKTDRASTYYELKECIANGGTAEDVATIIGNDSWTTLTCNLCHAKVDGLACFGEPYESYSEVCRSCLRVMHSLLFKAEMDDLGMKPSATP